MASDEQLLHWSPACLINPCDPYIKWLVGACRVTLVNLISTNDRSVNCAVKRSPPLLKWHWGGLLLTLPIALPTGIQLLELH